MNVYLTFDIEVWCSSWKELSTSFQDSYSRNVYGRSQQGDYALPKLLEILGKNKLHGVFFVEPLFSARFGLEYLRTIVKMIQDAGHEIQLHVHSEWVDEISPPPLPNINSKRQHLYYYTLQEQTQLIAYSIDLLHQAGVPQVTAFRAGSFAANVDTIAALQHNNILIDSSFNMGVAVSGSDLRKQRNFYTPFEMNGVSCYPMSVFIDGMGRHRHAQLGACSFLEIKQALSNAHRLGFNDFVILSHNFEMLKVDKHEPDRIVAHRFEKLCQYLAENPDRYTVSGWGGKNHRASFKTYSDLPSTSFFATLLRLVEQAIRRII